jgi:dihydrofolate reductase
MLTSLDGFYEGKNRDISWHSVDAEFNDFAIENLNRLDALLFGRVTYELMASYWPTPDATTNDPIVAARMNALHKFVVSTTLKEVRWDNSSLIRTNVAEQVLKLKQQPGKDIAIFGSSDLAVSLIPHGLIDEYRIIVNPLVLSSGKPLFDGLKDRLSLKLLSTRVFGNGNVLLCYQPDKH